MAEVPEQPSPLPQQRHMEVVHVALPVFRVTGRVALLVACLIVAYGLWNIFQVSRFAFTAERTEAGVKIAPNASGAGFACFTPVGMTLKPRSSSSIIGGCHGNFGGRNEYRSSTIRPTRKKHDSMFQGPIGSRCSSSSLVCCSPARAGVSRGLAERTSQGARLTRPRPSRA